MPVVEGFEVLTGSYLGQDWEVFGATPDEAIVRYASGHSADAVEASIAGFKELIASPMTEQEYFDRWVYGLHAGYDPRDDGYTFPEWFAHALELLRAEAAKTSG